MAATSSVCRGRVTLFVLLWGIVAVQAWDSVDLELFDLVEEIKDNFYHVLGLEESASLADIRRAYRKLSLQLHPDKNKGPDAETKFRQLVAVAEVLKDEDKRKRYDVILREGLPDWRQPVYYYRRVRKMGLFELALLIFLILTVGHYIVAWSIYLEKKFELEELVFAKKEKEDKKRRKNRGKGAIQDEDIPEIAERLVQEVGVVKPTLGDLLPFKLGRVMLALGQSLPAMCRDAIEHWKERRKEKLEDEALSDSEDENEENDQQPRPRRRHRVQLPDLSSEMDDGDWEGAPVVSSLGTNTTQPTQTDLTELKSGQWTDEDRSQLARAMCKFPGGTPGRWEKIALEIGRSLDEVTKHVKKMKQSYGAIPHPSDNAGEGMSANTLLLNKRNVVISDTILTRAENAGEAHEANTPSQTRATKRTPPASATKNERGDASSAVGKKESRSEETSGGKPQRSSNQTVEQPPSESGENAAQQRNGVGQEDGDDDGDVWTQNQQKRLELALQQFPRTVADRWTCIARAVPGKTKEECISRYKFLAMLVRQRKQGQQQTIS